MIVSGCRLGDRISLFWVWTNGLFAAAHWETNNLVLVFLLTDNKRTFLC